LNFVSVNNKEIAILIYQRISHIYEKDKEYEKIVSLVKELIENMMFE
jgi:hypothetical protein